MRFVKSLAFSSFGILGLSSFLIGWMAMAAAMLLGVGSALVTGLCLILAAVSMLIAALSLTAGAMRLLGAGQP